MQRSFVLWLALTVSVALLLSSCAAEAPLSDNGADVAGTSPVAVSQQWWDGVAKEDIPDIDKATAVHLSDREIAVEGDGVSVKRSVVTITDGGVYVFDGSLSDGQIRVEADGGQAVWLVMNGVDIHSRTTAPLFIRSCERAILTLAAGSENVLSDAADAVFEDTENEEPSGAVFSKTDLTVNGGGSLTVNAAFRDGIVSRDGLMLSGGTVTVKAADDAVMGRDYILVADSTYLLTAQGDGIKSTNDASETVGCITVNGGTLTIDSQKDGIQAESTVTVNGGTAQVTAGGGHKNGTANTAFDFGWGQQSADSESVGKGIKAGMGITVTDGQLSVDAADDAVHSNGTIDLAGGQLTAASGDDGIHADESVTIRGGSIHVTASYEALEAPTVTMDDGDVSLVASDDGINASAGSEGSTGDPYGQNPFASDDSLLAINGGKLAIDAEGDGLDSNGTVKVNGGEIYVCGPSNSSNGTLDFGAAFEVNGGLLVGIGSLGMAETPTSNTQNSIVWNGCSLQSGDTLTVKAEDGTVVASVVSARTAQWAYVTSPNLTEGKVYTVSDGTSEETLTLAGGENTIGTASGGFGGGRGPGMGGPPDGFHR